MVFSKFNVNRIEWLDVVFEHRNQSYGAYVLRRDSGDYLRRALLIASLLFTGIIVLSSINWMSHQQSIEPTKDLPKQPVLKVTQLKLPPKARLQQKLPKAAPAQKIKQIKSLPPRVVDDHKVTVEPPTTADIMNSLIGPQTIDGTEGTEWNAMPATDGKGTGGKGEDIDGSEKTFISVERMPEFPGGMDAWARFLNKNLRYPAIARDAGISGRVTLSFVVERNGEITNLKVLKGIGGGCDEEAMRVIKKSPLWSPGIQNGKPVRVSYVMPIAFRLAQ